MSKVRFYFFNSANMPETNNNITYKTGGIIIYLNNIPRVALLYRSKQDDWSFPKGHIENGEMSDAAALREVKEETGLDVEIIGELAPFEYLHATGRPILTYMYLMIFRGKEKFKEEHIGDRLEWVPLTEVEGKIKYDNLKKYFMKIKPSIEEILQKTLR